MHVVFDLDGVLLDSTADLGWLERALQQTLESFDVYPEPGTLELLFPADVETLERAADAFGVPMAELWSVRNDHYTAEKVAAIRAGEIEPFDDVGVLREIARDHPVSILSNSPTDVVESFVSVAGLGDVVMCRIGRGADLAAIDRLKPHPHLYEELAACAESDRYLYVGDSPDDEVFADRTGMAYIHLDRGTADGGDSRDPGEDTDGSAATELTANLGRRESREASATRDGRAATSLAEVRDRIETLT